MTEEESAMCIKRTGREPVVPPIAEADFATVITVRARDVSRHYRIVADSRSYTLLYRDGRFMGLPCPEGGIFYPFSEDPSVMGSYRDKRRFDHARILILRRDFPLRVYWGTSEPFSVEDSQTGIPYTLGARGSLSVNLDPLQAAEGIDRFCSCFIPQDAQTVGVDVLCAALSTMVTPQIGSTVAHLLWEHLTARGQSLSVFTHMSPGERLTLGEAACDRLENCFIHWGLTIDRDTSRGSVIEGMVLSPRAGA